MGFDLGALRAAVKQYGQVVRVVIAANRGSSPREVGAAMLVWKDGQTGTIGGGALEFEAADAARRMGVPLTLRTHALGPELGQCCGGAVTLLSEIYDAGALAGLEGDVVARPVAGDAALTLGVRRLLAQARQGDAPAAQMLDGWMIEPVHKPSRDFWIWGAGHVGRALVRVLAPLPDVAITWVDTGPERFPQDVSGVSVVPAARPAELVRHAPTGAEHLIVTYSHALDLELCDQLLRRGFRFAGLIGSRTKWVRFRARLAALGHTDKRIGRITCPMGDPGMGKHPQVIAVGVAAELLRPAGKKLTGEETVRKDRRA